LIIGRGRYWYHSKYYIEYLPTEYSNIFPNIWKSLATTTPLLLASPGPGSLAPLQAESSPAAASATGTSAAATPAPAGTPQPTPGVPGDLKQLQQWLKDRKKLGAEESLKVMKISDTGSVPVSHFHPYQSTGSSSPKKKKTHLCIYCWRPFRLKDNAASCNAREETCCHHRYWRRHGAVQTPHEEESGWGNPGGI